MSTNNLTYFLVPENNAPEIRLETTQPYRIGRSPSNNILLTDNAISREHAKLQFSGEAFVLEDLGSTNGTKVNGKIISLADLSNADILTFGKLNFTFTVKGDNQKEDKTLSPEDTRALEEDLSKIIADMANSSLKDQLMAFQNKLKEKKRNMLELAYGDSLTGLFNRRYFDKILANEIKRSIRYGRSLTLIMVDIDHFKKFNDTYGHQKGDSVLRTVGTILKENSRSSDIVCRYGGEEMAILLPEQNLEHGLVTAEKLRKKLVVEAREIEEVDITASFGVSSTGGHRITGEQLIQISDKALYQAKKDGRNCVKALRINNGS